ncbi:MAG: RidA family protein [Proteobacteria bacterium]|nr:RidA family protein [Pseudomonadota bacterium]
MSGKIDARLKELGITLPDAPAPVANYLPYVVAGGLVFVSGQVPLMDGKIAKSGAVGDGTMTEEDAKGEARKCAINLLAQAKAACGGDLDKVKRVVKLGGFVASTPEFTNQPAVINVASDLMVEVFGEVGRHARFAVGSNVLPRGCLVEIEGIFAL